MRRTILIAFVAAALALLIVNGIIPWWLTLVVIIAYIVVDQL